METKITESTAMDGLGLPAGRNLFKIPCGAFSGRLAAIVQTSSSIIRLLHADYPYRSWSEPLPVADDSRNDRVDAAMDAEGNIYIVYSSEPNGDLVYRRLAYADGTWTVGAAVTVYNGAVTFGPSIAVEPSGKLWVSYSRQVAANRDTHVKASIDGGEVWGSGPGDAGQSFTSGYMNSHSRLLTGADRTMLVYTAGDATMFFRWVPFGDDTWSAEATIAGGTGLDKNFDAAVGSDGLLAVVWDDDGLKYREFDGLNWGAVVSLDADVAFSPQVCFRQGAPVVVYVVPWLGDKGHVRYVERIQGVFSEPADLDPRARAFERVTLYHSGSANYADRTSEAAGPGAGDVFHPDSGCLVQALGDAVYLGMDDRFRSFEAVLSTVGVGGAVVYAYWDGVAWKAFTPTSGQLGFDTSQVDVVLWPDYASMPSDWQRREVNGNNRFWIRAEVVSAFATGPIVDHLTAIGQPRTLSFRR